MKNVRRVPPRNCYNFSKLNNESTFWEIRTRGSQRVREREFSGNFSIDTCSDYPVRYQTETLDGKPFEVHKEFNLFTTPSLRRVLFINYIRTRPKREHNYEFLTNLNAVRIRMQFMNKASSWQKYSVQNIFILNLNLCTIQSSYTKHAYFVFDDNSLLFTVGIRHRNWKWLPITSFTWKTINVTK